MTTTAPTSWRPEVQIGGPGEKDKWRSNALRFATEQEALDNARDLMSRWFMVLACRAAPSDDPVNYRWTRKGLEAVESVANN